MKWNIEGDVILSCNCDLFCPCVVSLGRARPSQGYCQSWWGVRIKSGRAGDESLDGLHMGILLDVPGRMGEGGWTIALFVDERATEAAFLALRQIFTGQAGGSLAILSLLVGEVLATERAALDFADTENGWRMTAVCADKKVADCAVNRIDGQRDGEPVTITNSQYWVSPDVVVAVGGKSRVRAFGRIWDFSGQSAEYAKVSWRNE